MQKKRRLSKNEFVFFLFLAFITGIIYSYYCLFSLYNNNYIESTLINDYFISIHQNYNYFDGIYMIPLGLFWFSIICLLELPIKTNEIINKYYPILKNNALKLIKKYLKR